MTMTSTQVADPMDRLAALLGESGRFRAYQAIPEFARARCPDLDGLSYAQARIPGLDEARLDWLGEQFDDDIGSVLEIGANLGFFSLSLAERGAAPVHAYEPEAALSDATALIAGMIGLADRLHCRSTGVAIADLVDLPAVDLMIHLNVLHHAGIAYDHEAVAAAGGWMTYAHDYLAGIRAERLFLQTGNSAGDATLFPSEDAIPVLGDLLAGAGWSVAAVGVIEDFDQLTYRTFGVDALATAPRARCSRNTETGLVDYERDGQVVASLETGAAARPLWLCRRMETGT